MNECLYNLMIDSLEMISPDRNALTALESGSVVFLPNLTFKLNELEHCLLNENILDPKHKNISYDYHKKQIKGVALKAHTNPLDSASLNMTQKFIHRFTEYAQALITKVFPEYKNHLQLGRTSYRPAEVKNRVRSKRQDDTRVHVDSFAATPVNGLRILRVFCNINPQNIARVWQIGEDFSVVLDKFYKHIPTYKKNYAKLLKLIKATKTLRTPYDHYMLNLHDMMKLDDQYQNNVAKTKIEFPAQSTWIVFTDNVSHAALSGQFLLEQTFYLPVNGMQQPELSPLKVLERMSLKPNK